MKNPTDIKITKISWPNPESVMAWVQYLQGIEATLDLVFSRERISSQSRYLGCHRYENFSKGGNWGLDLCRAVKRMWRFSE